MSKLMISLNRTHNGWIQTAAGLLSLLLLLIPNMNAGAEEAQGTKVSQKTLERAAALNLWRLKKAVEEDGFYNAHIILNVWRSTALDAGTFDQTTYEEFKTRLYQKSINESLQCFEMFLFQEDYHNADICLQTWRIHSKELGVYKEDRYKALKKRINDSKAKKQSEKKVKDEK